MKNDKDVVFYKDEPVIIKDKISHIRGLKKRPRRGFILMYGDVPTIHYNPITDKFEKVENKRGKAYAARRRQMYRKKGVKYTNEDE